MRVAITVPHFSLDIGRNESGLGEGLAKLGHEATVFATDINGKKGHEARAIAGREERPYAVELVRSIPGTAINPAPLGQRLKIQGFRPDVVHSSEDTDLLTVATFKATQSLGLPFVLSTERYYVPKFPKSLGYLAIEALWTKRIRREADAVTTHSTIQESYWEARGLNRSDIEMIPVGVWTDHFAPGPSTLLRDLLPLPEGSVIGFTVGRMTAYKDYPTMLRAMQAVIERDRSFHLAVLGFGPDRVKVVRRAREMGLESNVHFLTERIRHTRMPEALRSADFYLQTSSVEPFGITVIEAMATGIPVVTTDVGGMRDTVLEGKVGLKAPAGDAAALAQRILALRDDTLRRRLGTAAREYAVGAFDWMVVCRAYLGAYARAAEVAADKRRARLTRSKPTTTPAKSSIQKAQ
jgi:glycosyltransferase involved in cell wall biosynthesis